MKKLPERATEALHDAKETNESLNETLIELLKENRGCSDQHKFEWGKVLGLSNIMAGRVVETDDYKVGEYSRADTRTNYEVCNICKRGDDLFSEDEDGPEMTIYWVVCEKCGRWYHKVCM